MHPCSPNTTGTWVHERFPGRGSVAEFPGRRPGERPHPGRGLGEPEPCRAPEGREGDPGRLQGSPFQGYPSRGHLAQTQEHRGERSGRSPGSSRTRQPDGSPSGTHHRSSSTPPTRTDGSRATWPGQRSTSRCAGSMTACLPWSLVPPEVRARPRSSRQTSTGAVPVRRCGPRPQIGRPVRDQSPDHLPRADHSHLPDRAGPIDEAPPGPDDGSNPRSPATTTLFLSRDPAHGPRPQSSGHPTRPTGNITSTIITVSSAGEDREVFGGGGPGGAGPR
jgi:hypothetical protein